MKKLLLIFILSLVLISLGFSGNKPTLVITSAESNFLTAEWITKYNEMLVSSIANSLVFDAIYEPSLSTQLNYYFEKDKITDERFRYTEQFLRSHGTDYVLFFTINQLWRFEYSVHFQILDMATRKIFISETYIVDKQSKIDDSILEFGKKVAEFEKNYKTFTEPYQETSRDFRSLLIAFALGAVLTGGLAAIIIFTRN